MHDESVTKIILGTEQEEAVDTKADSAPDEYTLSKMTYEFEKFCL